MCQIPLIAITHYKYFKNNFIKNYYFFNANNTRNFTFQLKFQVFF